MSQEILEAKELLAELPEITLPESLTPEALWARLDAGELTAPQPPTAMDNFIDLTRRMRPVLSYAAIFILMVAVYYGTGMDRAAQSYSSAAPAPMAMSIAADNAQPDMAAAQPRMAAPQGAPEPEAAPNAAPEAAPEAAMNGEPNLMMANEAAQLHLVAVVQVGEAVVLEIDLSQTPDGEIDLPEDAGVVMTLEVKDGAVAIVQADCSDQQCVQAGFISQPRAMVCCLKNQVLVTLEERE